MLAEKPYTKLVATGKRNKILNIFNDLHMKSQAGTPAAIT
jgi:hypothetical protein